MHTRSASRLYPDLDIGTTRGAHRSNRRQHRPAGGVSAQDQTVFQIVRKLDVQVHPEITQYTRIVAISGIHEILRFYAEQIAAVTDVKGGASTKAKQGMPSGTGAKSLLTHVILWGNKGAADGELWV